MTCDQCGQTMWVNGSHWQCPSGHLKPYNPGKPNGAAPAAK